MTIGVFVLLSREKGVGIAIFTLVVMGAYSLYNLVEFVMTIGRRIEIYNDGIRIKKVGNDFVGLPYWQITKIELSNRQIFSYRSSNAIKLFGGNPYGTNMNIYYGNGEKIRITEEFENIWVLLNVLGANCPQALYIDRRTGKS
ncbi:hypothetical protein [Butyrivibrio proteoclasticus]|uniref:hypothetical protein n=1 Tax=Butyrivibrio proteoclasticus TaxID=43305 RepID=UPI00047C9F98|nr:hypothetical protein [Butyrivibrio proteoclasticus]